MTVHSESQIQRSVALNKEKFKLKVFVLIQCYGGVVVLISQNQARNENACLTKSLLDMLKEKYISIKLSCKNIKSKRVKLILILPYIRMESILILQITRLKSHSR